MKDDNGTTRVNPEVDEQLLNDLKVAIRAFNEGKLKGRLSRSIEEAMQLYLVTILVREPGQLKHLERYLDPEDVDELDDPDDYRERIIEYQDQTTATIQEVAHVLNREEPGGPTDFAKMLDISGKSETGDDDGDNTPMYNSVLTDPKA
jgi:hypothetical protein